MTEKETFLFRKLKLIKNMNNQTINNKQTYFVPMAIIVAGVIIAGAIIFTRTSQPSVETSKKSETTQTTEDFPDQVDSSKKFAVVENDHFQGNVEAPVTIVEFSDFECPFCQRFHPTVKQVLEDYPDKVRWVYKHFPLDSIHSQARPAAEASECVAEQRGNEGFWQFADGLFENQSRLGEPLYKELAENIGLNINQFNDCLSSRKYKDKVEADYQEGIKAGVRGTPGSFVNGEEVSGAVPYDTLKAAVEKAITNLE